MKIRTKEERDKIVNDFAELMKEQLDANTDKDDWSEQERLYLFALMAKEVGKIGRELAYFIRGGRYVRRGCANIANYAMMIAQHRGGDHIPPAKQ